MRSVALMMLFAGASFGASAAGSWFLQSKMQKSTDDVEGAVSESPTDPARPDLPAGSSGVASSGSDLPVAVRPRPMSVEEVLRFGMGLRKREEQLKEREKTLDREQSRMQLAMADIRGEQQHIESLHAKLEGQAEAGRQILDEIQQARQKLAAEREDAQKEFDEFEEVRLESDEQERDNIKKMSEWFQGMEPERAAGALQQLVKDGKTDLAVRLLSNFEDRDAAKILSALDDYALMVELAERFKNFKHPPSKETRRR